MNNSFIAFCFIHIYSPFGLLLFYTSSSSFSFYKYIIIEYYSSVFYLKNNKDSSFQLSFIDNVSWDFSIRLRKIENRQLHS